MRGRRVVGVALLGVAISTGAGVANPGTADAAAYTKNVYAPVQLSGEQMEAWADVSRDCDGTLGCRNYMKIERQVMGEWIIDEVAGQWAQDDGWNRLAAELTPGCHHYRTTVFSYNDVVGGYGEGVNIGTVGASQNGEKISRYEVDWSSGWTMLCR